MYPKLEFASTVWNPYNQKDIQAIQMYDRYTSFTTIISQKPTRKKI